MGFREEGFDIVCGIDIDKDAINSSILNFPDTTFINSDIRDLHIEDIDRTLRKERGEGLDCIDVVIGGAPCQAFSTGGKRLGVNDKRKNKGGDLIHHFLRIVGELQPPVFVMENVKGLASSALKHISFYERISNPGRIPKECMPGSYFNKLLEEIQELGYRVHYKILNAADYGVPQKRERVFIVGVRGEINYKFPKPTHINPDKIGPLLQIQEPWVTLREVIGDLEMYEGHEYIDFPPSWGRYMHLVPEGGCWVDLPEEIQREVLGGAYDDPSDPLKYKKRGGRRGFMRRLNWDKPAPTLVTSPVMKGSVLAHPSQNRPLSIQEYKRIQQFPDNFRVLGSTQKKYKLLGEAVPVGLSKAIAKSVKLALSSALHTRTYIKIT